MLKEKLRKKEVTLGSWITIPHPSIAEILASAKVPEVILLVGKSATLAFANVPEVNLSVDKLGILASAKAPVVTFAVSKFGISAASKVIKLLGTPVDMKLAVSLAFVILLSPPY
jgi:2-keto-3-deoxy-L-rhamnonate aldolase RhmA